METQPMPPRTNGFKVKIKLGGRTQLDEGTSSAKRKLQQLLTGYPDPSASIQCLAGVLRLHGDTKHATEFPSWSEMLAELGHSDKPSKRMCSGTNAAGSQEQPGTLQAQGGQQHATSRAEKPEVCKPSPAAREQPRMDAVTTGKASAESGVASSASDQTKASANPPVTQPVTQPARPEAVRDQVPKKSPRIPERSTSDSRAATASRPRPRATGHPVSVQTQETISLLPAILLSAHNSASSGAPGAQPLSLSHLCLPPHQCFLPVSSANDPPASDAEFTRLINAAQDRKRQADTTKGVNPWTLGTLSMYVQAALLFMKAVECLLQLPSTPERIYKAASFCVQTTDLLAFTVRCIEGLSDSNTVRECLRTLCERLAAVCLLKECTLTASKYKDYADKLDRLLQKSRAGGLDSGSAHGDMAAAMPGNPSRKHGDPSPDDSHASSNDMRAATHTRPTAQVNASSELGILQSKMVAQARQMAKFSDLVRRSVSSFQALTEKEELRNSPQAMQALMHISAVCMSGGCVDGARVIAHALQALKCFKEL